MRHEVAVLGAGLIGLGVAFELLERGARVRVFDRNEPAHAASWAAAGMLAPATEGIADGPFADLCTGSLQAYPEFVTRVRQAGGVDPYLHLDGIVDVAFGDAGLARLEGRAAVLRAREAPHALWSRADLLEREPWLGAAVRGGLIVEGEGCVDNRRLGRALEAAVRARGGEIARVHEVALECDDRRVLGVRTERGFTPVDAAVNACGAAAAELEGVPADCRPPVRPVKGQMLALAVPEGLVRRPVWVPGAYLVPRDDGRLLVGATVEEAADARVTAGGVAALLAAALEAAPALAGFTVSETWAGLRPGTPDGLPFLGPTRLAGLYLATGHYRNGVLLTPATARLIAEAVLGETSDVLRPFGLARLGTDAERGARIPST